MAPSSVLPLLAASFVTCLAQSNFSGVWHLVNVQSVVCPNAPGYTLINISQPTDDLSRPHIFTIFRTAKTPVTLDFTATDSTGKQVATFADTLQQARRLSLAEQPRRLSARRRFGGGGSTYSSPRRRTPSPQPTSYSSPRRRTPSSPSPSPPVTTGSRRRTFGYDNKAHNNPSNPAAGNYGYQTPTAAASNFGGKIPTGTPYGYTGANAYSGSSGSGAKIAMAAGAGLLAGYVGSQLLSPSWTGYNREQMLNMPCRSGTWTGLCSTCVSLHGAQNCNIEISPKIDATRDDLLSTGFIPKSLTWPLIVNITKISGVDFDASKICPNASDPSWTSSGKQLFITLTTLQELASGSQASTGSSSSMSWWPVLGAVLVIGGCCCFGLLAFRMCKGGQGSYGGYGSSSESDWSEADPHGPPIGYPGHQPYGAQVPQQGYNPYWQGGAPQPIQGMVVQGSPVGQPHRAGVAAVGAVGAVGAVAGGFMDTAAPGGTSWANFCQPHPVVVDPSTGMISGPWGECLAWAVAYEQQNPGWHQDPRFQAEGPAGQVIGEISAKANPAALPQVVEAAERLEEACQQAIQHGQPLPLINRRV